MDLTRDLKTGAVIGADPAWQINLKLALLLKEADFGGFLAVEIDFLHSDYQDEDEAVAQSVQELKRIAAEVG